MPPLEFETVSTLLPYRPPMLMIDRVSDWSEKTITVEKQVLISDPVVASHLVYGPKLMPGVLLIELVGQGAFLHQLLLNRVPEQPPNLLGRCKARFIGPAPIGARIVAVISHVGSALGGAVHHGQLSVDGKLIAEIEVMSAAAPAEMRSDLMPQTGN